MSYSRGSMQLSECRTEMFMWVYLAATAPAPIPMAGKSRSRLPAKNILLVNNTRFHAHFFKSSNPSSLPFSLNSISCKHFKGTSGPEPAMMTPQTPQGGSGDRPPSSAASSQRGSVSSTTNKFRAGSFGSGLPRPPSSLRESRVGYPYICKSRQQLIKLPSHSGIPSARPATSHPITSPAMQPLSHHDLPH